MTSATAHKLQVELLAHQQLLRQREAGIDGLNEKIADLKEALLHRDLALAAAKQAVAVAEAQKDLLQSQKERSEAQLRQDTVQREDDAQHELERRDQRIESLRRDLHGAEQRLQREAQRLQLQIAEKDEALAKAAAIQRQADDWQGQAVSLQTQLRRCQDAADQAARAADEAACTALAAEAALDKIRDNGSKAGFLHDERVRELEAALQLAWAQSGGSLGRHVASFHQQSSRQPLASQVSLAAERDAHAEAHAEAQRQLQGAKAQLVVQQAENARLRASLRQEESAHSATRLALQQLQQNVAHNERLARSGGGATTPTPTAASQQAYSRGTLSYDDDDGALPLRSELLWRSMQAASSSQQHLAAGAAVTRSPVPGKPTPAQYAGSRTAPPSPLGLETSGYGRGWSRPHSVSSIGPPAAAYNRY